MKRSAGILLPVFSLPSRYGIGCFDESAYQFVDWLKAAGQTYWQILPLGATSYGDSPYQSFSVFAGNPYFISLTELVKAGLLTEAECSSADSGSVQDRVDYETLCQNRYPLLRRAYERSGIAGNTDFVQFCKETPWLEDYALFMAVKHAWNGAAWHVWGEDIRMRKPQAMEEARQLLAEDAEFYKFLQYHFYRQWRKLKAYANENGVQIIGDIPIYTAYDSADVWADPALFQLDHDGTPIAVAGCPPDGFAADGQLWGNPLYAWEKHAETGYAWWISRLAHCFDLYDVVRIDHFRGFDEYYAIPYGDRTARNGHWEKGPGMALFRAVEHALGKKEVIAEDLGFMTDSVRQLVKACGFPNMKVLEFAFDSRDTGSRRTHLPHNYTENCTAYTGTHDNQTIASWFDTITSEERTMAREYLCDKYTPDAELHKAFISLLFRSRADLCVIPMQDWLGLDDTSRMNTPSTVGGNWKWRLQAHALSAELCREIKKITQRYER